MRVERRQVIAREQNAKRIACFANIHDHGRAIAQSCHGHVERQPGTDLLLADITSERAFMQTRPDERRVLAHQIRQVDVRHAAEEAPIVAQPRGVAGRHCCRVPRAAGDAEANGRGDAKLGEGFDDADLKHASRRAAGEKKADAFRGADPFDHG